MFLAFFSLFVYSSRKLNIVQEFMSLVMFKVDYKIYMECSTQKTWMSWIWNKYVLFIKYNIDKILKNIWCNTNKKQNIQNQNSNGGDMFPQIRKMWQKENI